MKNINLQVLLFTFLRWIISINMRMVYPFLPVFARGLGVSINELALAISARNLMGSFSFLLAPIADRLGRKTGILISLAFPIVGNALVLIRPGYFTFLIGMGLSYMGSVLFSSSVQAYLGDHIPYHRRARAVGMIELGWAMAFILGMPLVGWMINRTNWVSPFAFLLIMGLISFISIKKLLPESANRKSNVPIHVLFNFKQVLATPAAWNGLLMSFMFIVSQEMINLVFGVWLEDSFSLKIAALGAASAVIGMADLGGALLTATAADRLGKKRSIRIGMVLNGIIVLVLPWISKDIIGAFIGLFLLYFTAEFVINCSLPIMAEILPHARATLMGMTIATYAFARAVGALVSPVLYNLGFQANTTAAFFLVIGAFFFLRSVNIQAPQDNPVPKSDE